MGQEAIWCNSELRTESSPGLQRVTRLTIHYEYSVAYTNWNEVVYSNPIKPYKTLPLTSTTSPLPSLHRNDVEVADALIKCFLCICLRTYVLLRANDFTLDSELHMRVRPPRAPLSSTTPICNHARPAKCPFHSFDSIMTCNAMLIVYSTCLKGGLRARQRWCLYGVIYSRPVRSAYQTPAYRSIGS